MALRSNLNNDEPDLGELLADLENRLERLKRLFEQYFLGIQKMPPSQLHKEVDRTIRELTQKKPRNTALRYRLTMITQRFGAYNTYWNRVLRQIEQGTYIRDIHRVKRRAYSRGEEIPDEVLAKMPALMRKRVLRDREKLARRAEAQGAEAGGEAPGAPTSAPRPPTVHHIDETDPLLGDNLDTDMDALFSSILSEDTPLGGASAKPPPPLRAETSPVVHADEPGEKVRAAWHEPGAKAAKPTRPPPATGDGSWREPGRVRPPPPPPRPASRRAAASGSALPPGLDERKARALYDKYVRARKAVGASSEVSFSRLMTTLSSQAPRIMAQHRANSVEFNVVLKENRVVVKATPKK